MIEIEEEALLPHLPHEDTESRHITIDLLEVTTNLLHHQEDLQIQVDMDLLLHQVIGILKEDILKTEIELVVRNFTSEVLDTEILHLLEGGIMEQQSQESRLQEIVKGPVLVRIPQALPLSSQEDHIISLSLMGLNLELSEDTILEWTPKAVSQKSQQLKTLNKFVKIGEYSKAVAKCFMIRKITISIIRLGS